MPLMPLATSNRVRLSSRVLTALPPGTLESDTDCVPALCDDGASRNASCCRTLDGALLDTLDERDAGGLDVGEDGVQLTSNGSYLYLLERFGRDGSGEVVLRRMKHTPNLRLKCVVSEPTEVYSHEYEFAFNKREGRVMSRASGDKIPLFMSKNGLGWLKVRPVTEPQRVAELRAAFDSGSHDGLHVIQTEMVS